MPKGYGKTTEVSATIIFSISHMSKLRHIEITWYTWGERPNNWWSKNSILEIWLQIMYSKPLYYAPLRYWKEGRKERKKGKDMRKERVITLWNFTSTTGCKLSESRNYILFIFISLLISTSTKPIAHSECNSKNSWHNSFQIIILSKYLLMGEQTPV